MIKTPGCWKANRLCHINMLKAYHERESVALITTAAAKIGRLDSDAEGAGAAEIVDKGPKLQNSDILYRLEASTFARDETRTAQVPD